MDGLEVKTSDRLRTRICVFDSLQAAIEAGPAQIFEEPSFVVLEKAAVSSDLLPAFQSFLSSKKRKFEQPFHDAEAARGYGGFVVRLRAELNGIFEALFPEYSAERMAFSLRNMRSGPEPMHYDSYDPEGFNVVCAFYNVGKEARRYRISYDFGQLVEENPDLPELARKWRAEDRNVSVELRGLWKNLQGPGEIWHHYHEAAFPPGALWFFSPKTIAHQLMSGDGVVGMSWHVTGCGLKSQEAFLAS